MEAFFSEPREYLQLGLAPFRVLPLVGPPGTGKTTPALLWPSCWHKVAWLLDVRADDDGASFRKVHHALNVVAEAQHPVLLIVGEIDVYLRKDDKAQILNVLDGLESPNNPRGAMPLATTNYPEVIDERIAKRPGRVDRIIHVPLIQDIAQAEQMLIRYMGASMAGEEHRAILPQLVGQTGACARGRALCAHAAAHNRQTSVSEVLVPPVSSLSSQLATGADLQPRRSIGFGARRATFES